MVTVRAFVPGNILHVFPFPSYFFNNINPGLIDVAMLSWLEYCYSFVTVFQLSFKGVAAMPPPQVPVNGQFPSNACK